MDPADRRPARTSNKAITPASVVKLGRARWRLRRHQSNPPSTAGSATRRSAPAIRSPCRKQRQHLVPLRRERKDHPAEHRPAICPTENMLSHGIVMPSPFYPAGSLAYRCDMERPDPFILFDNWYAEARASEINDSNAMALATAGADGLPSVRMVLLKGHGADLATMAVSYSTPISKAARPGNCCKIPMSPCFSTGSLCAAKSGSKGPLALSKMLSRTPISPPARAIRNWVPGHRTNPVRWRTAPHSRPALPMSKHGSRARRPSPAALVGVDGQPEADRVLAGPRIPPARTLAL